MQIQQVFFIKLVIQLIRHPCVLISLCYWVSDYCNHPNDIRLLLPSSGNVGIGTTLPTQKLHVAHNDSAGTSAGMILENLASGNKNSEIKFNQNGTPLWAIGNDVSHNGGQNFFIYDEQATSNSTRFFINSAGQVGIGYQPAADTTSIYMLYVQGGIKARDMKVTATSYPDYVFHKDYKPMTLKALDIYIKIHNHLPDVLSEEEVKKNDGFEVGAMQTTLLKKVEEEALYIIDLQKQIDEI